MTKKYLLARKIKLAFACVILTLFVVGTISYQDIALGKPQEILRLAALNGLHEVQDLRVRREGTRFLVRSTYMASRDAEGH